MPVWSLAGAAGPCQVLGDVRSMHTHLAWDGMGKSIPIGLSGSVTLSNFCSLPVACWQHRASFCCDCLALLSENLAAPAAHLPDGTGVLQPPAGLACH